MHAWFRTHSTVAAALLLVSATATSARADEPLLGEKIVGAMVKIFGDHPGIRTNHAKGVVVEGTFIPSGDGAALTTAPLFQPGPPTPVTARFSDATGVPAIPDGDPNANPHGMAVQFQLADGGVFDLVANSLTIFPVATGEAFLELLNAIAASGPDAPKPTALDTFVAAHPTVVEATAALATPAHFGRETYNGINAFVFVDADGKRQPFRFRIAPVAGDLDLSAEDAARQAPDFLRDGLLKDLAQGPIRFRLTAQLAEPGDATDDPSKAWPAERRVIDLGEIELTTAAADNAAAEKALMLLPGNLPGGVEPSDDPMIAVRNETYAVSFGRRLD